MSDERDVAQALLEALKESNKAMEPFMGESYELCYRLEENEDLIQMVEHDVEHF
ncbi:hypothetical protein ACKGJO_06655 [Gracilimonas sp. Q87]|uniref:hypothetical protein n=1 Tax=Gracilimonas sp. Q87 TaxID=3384766 RepID=UPI003983F487